MWWKEKEQFWFVKVQHSARNCSKRTYFAGREITSWQITLAVCTARKSRVNEKVTSLSFGIKQIHRPGGAMYRPIQGHKWQWHHEWRRVSSKSHEWCHWHEWPCIGWYIPHPGRCISNPLWKHNHLWCIAYHPWCIIHSCILHKRVCCPIFSNPLTANLSCPFPNFWEITKKSDLIQFP